MNISRGTLYVSMILQWDNTQINISKGMQYIKVGFLIKKTYKYIYHEVHHIYKQASLIRRHPNTHM